MISYKDARYNLERRGFDTVYFTEEFYNTFVRERREVLEHNDSKKFEKTKGSRFYTLTNDSYCEFMEIFNATLPMFIFRFHKDGDVEREVIGSYDNMDEAVMVAIRLEEITGCRLEVNRI